MANLGLIAAAVAVLFVASTTATIGDLRVYEETCVEVLDYPNEYVRLMRSFQYPDNRYIRCLMRCVGILNGFYTDDGGPNLEVLYQRLVVDIGGSLTREQFFTRSTNCLAAVPPSGVPLDVCDKCWDIYKCFERDYQDGLRNDDRYLSGCK